MGQNSPSRTYVKGWFPFHPRTQSAHSRDITLCLSLENPTVVVHAVYKSASSFFFVANSTSFTERPKNTCIQGACLIDAITKLVEALALLQPAVPNEGGQEPSPDAKDRADERHTEQPAQRTGSTNYVGDVGPSSMSESKPPSIGEEGDGKNREKENANIVETSCNAERDGRQKTQTTPQHVVRGGEGGRGKCEATEKVGDGPRGSKNDHPLSAKTATAAAATPHVDFWDRLR